LLCRGGLDLGYRVKAEVIWRGQARAEGVKRVGGYVFWSVACQKSIRA